jgi:hypothetical protein
MDQINDPLKKARVIINDSGEISYALTLIKQAYDTS